MDELLEYEGLVYSIINKYNGRIDVDDLYQVGMIGLIEAYKHFDSSHNIKFSSYAYYYIVGEITKFIRNNRPVRVSRDVIKLNKSIDKAKELMTQRLGREPSDLEISLFLEIDEEKITEARSLLDEVKSLDYSIDDNSMYDTVSSFDPGMNTDLIDLRTEISKLPREDREILIERYFNDLTQSEASRKLGISQVQVSRKEGKILEKLRSRL